MCEIATGVMAASALIGGAGALKSGSSAQSQARGEAALYRSQAAARLAKAEFDADAAHRKYRRSAGQVEARSGGSGVSMESFYDIMNDDAAEAALERAAIRWSSKNEANMLEYQATSAIRRGNDAKSASYINAAGAVARAFYPYGKSAYGKRVSGVTMDDNDTAYTGSLK